MHICDIVKIFSYQFTLLSFFFLTLVITNFKRERNFIKRAQRFEETFFFINVSLSFVWLRDLTEKRFDQIQRQSITDRIKHIEGETFFIQWAGKEKKTKKNKQINKGLSSKNVWASRFKSPTVEHNLWLLVVFALFNRTGLKVFVSLCCFVHSLLFY